MSINCCNSGSCSALPPTPCPTDPTTTSCHSVNTYQSKPYDFRLNEHRLWCAPTQQAKRQTPCNSSGLRGKLRNPIKELATMHVCGDAIIKCSLSVGQTLNACSVGCPSGGTLVVTSPSSFSSPLSVCNLSPCSLGETVNLTGGNVDVVGNVNVDGTLTVCNVDCIDNSLQLPELVTGTVEVCTIQCTGGSLMVLSDLYVGGDVNVGTVEVCNIAACSDDGTIIIGAANMEGNFGCTIACNSGSLLVQGALDVQSTLSVGGELEVCTIECPSGTLSITSPGLSIDGTLQVCTLSCASTLVVGPAIETDGMVVDEIVGFTGDLEVCRIDCPTGTLQMISPVQIQGELEACALQCSASPAISTADILTSVVNTTFNPTIPSLQNGTLVVGSTGGTVATIRSLTSMQNNILIGIISLLGQQAVNLQQNTAIGIFAVTNGQTVQTQAIVTGTRPRPQAPINFNSSIIPQPAFYSLTTGGINILQSGLYITFFDFDVAADDVNLPINCTFLNVRMNIQRSGTPIIERKQLYSQIFGTTGTAANATTLWNNVGTNLSSSRLTTGLERLNNYSNRPVAAFKVEPSNVPTRITIFVDADNTPPQLFLFSARIFFLRINDYPL